MKRLKRDKVFTLLNSEGPVLTVKKSDIDEYVIYDKEDSIVDILDNEQMYKFTRGELILHGPLTDYHYSSYPGSMKPDLKRLDEFIGVDTTDKIY